MKLLLINFGLQTLLLTLGAPLLSGLIKNWKAKLQNRRGPPVWQPYRDWIKFFHKDRVISEHASWIFSLTPWVVFVTALLAGLMVPLGSAHAPVSLLGGVLAVIYLLGLGRFFLALAGLDTASAFGGMGSSREMTIAAIAEPALMLAIFSAAITARSTNLEPIAAAAIAQPLQFLNPAQILAGAALFMVLLAETGRLPVDNPATHLELTMIHEAMILEYSGPNLALIEWGSAIKQLVLMALLINVFVPYGMSPDLSWAGVAAGLGWLGVKLLGLAGLIVLVETGNAKLRLFRVPDLLTAAFVLAALALISNFLF